MGPSAVLLEETRASAVLLRWGLVPGSHEVTQGPASALCLLRPQCQRIEPREA